ncbi:hypothetical protein FJY63_02420, partial [Candidatus Sumerlaeota bacterium]|nr:hypothetical protein [Candidatus Sumerlaeota bacterium]
RNVLERVYVETRAQVIGHNAFREWVRERDYLTAGGWNLERLESQRLTAPVIVMPAVSGRNARLGAEASGFQRSATDYAPQHGASFPLAIAHERGWTAAQPPIDAAYSVSQPVARKHGPLTEETIRRAFAEAKGNATLAARMLGVHKATLYRHMRALGLSRRDLETTAPQQDKSH